MPDDPSLELHLGPYQRDVDAQVAAWRRDGVAERLRAQDPTLWFLDPVPELADRLGWLTLPQVPEELVGDWTGFALAEREAGIERVVVLGMGGSSLAPEVFSRTLGEAGRLWLLDTTHPDAVGRLADALDLERTVFVVSSKSGSTIETRSLFELFWQRAGDDARDAGRRFVVITDPESSLEALAARRRVHRIFAGPVDVGGRYSALSAFGLVPAALAGVDIRAVVRRARRAAEALADSGRAGQLLDLGAALGRLALAGRDKLTVWTSAALRSFPDWLEQLVAESTGKLGRGIVPVVGERPLPPDAYGDDRLFVAIVLAADRGGELERHLRSLAAAGLPVALIELGDAYDLGFEMFRWEVAVALAGQVLEVNPFDQPNVEAAKKLARAAMSGETGLTASLERLEIHRGVEPALRGLGSWWPPGPPAYVALQAYVAPNEAADRALARLREIVRRATGCAVTVGYGPRFLHSTGQLHKGGPAAAWCLQLLVGPRRDLGIPGEELSFGQLLVAQADGDAAALLESERPVRRIQLESAGDLHTLADRLQERS